jgi:UDP-GlcNAc:undecaprenyl-phosphate/decaprenyl-phosphate GlcNAc-1-phosphate transferase
MIFILVFSTAFLLALLLTPIAIRVAKRTGAVDQPGGRHIHSEITPSWGGLPLFVAFFAAVAVSLMYPRTDPNETSRLLGLFLGSLLIFVVGTYDDYHELNATVQLIAQTIAAVIAVASGVLIGQVSNPFGEPITFDTWFAIAFTLFWIVGMTNTVNWLDGVDGLAAGVVGIAGVILFLHAFFVQEQYSIALLALALIGAVLGFLPYNFAPAKVFMGTAGALVLGYEMGVLSIIGSARVAFALLALGIPILDVAWQILSRLRAGRSPFSADRGHLHHRLLDHGLNQRTIVLLYYTLTAFFGALTLILPSGAYKLIAMIVVGAGAVLVLVKIRGASPRCKGDDK